MGLCIKKTYSNVWGIGFFAITWVPFWLLMHCGNGNKEKAWAQGHEYVGNLAGLKRKREAANHGGRVEVGLGISSQYSLFIRSYKGPTVGFANTCVMKCSVSGITRIGAIFTGPHLSFSHSWQCIRLLLDLSNPAQLCCLSCFLSTDLCDWSPFRSWDETEWSSW